MLKFKTIEIEGFRSIVDNLMFDLDRPGLNMVKGTNGVGKTTLFEALVWCLYGANLKGTVNAKVHSWKEVRESKYQGTKVITTFFHNNIEYVIERNLGYSIVGDALIVEKNGVQIPDLDKKDIQQYIDDLMTMDFKTFMNSFMFGQRMTRLVESSSADKRKLFEELFDMEWIQTMRDKVSEDIKNLDADLVDADHLANQIALSIIFHKEKVEDAEKELNNAGQVRAIKVKENEEFIESCIDANKAISEDITRYKKELVTLPSVANIVDNCDRIAGLEGTFLSVEGRLRNAREARLSTLSRANAKKEQLENYDTENYDAYLANVAGLEKEMSDIVGKLFDDASGTLTEDEKTQIQLDYEKALKVHNSIQQDRDKHIKDIRDLKENTVCPACNRPYDNADDVEIAIDKAENYLESTKGNLQKASASLNAMRDDAKLLEEYNKLELHLKPMHDHAPEDPEVAKAAIKKEIDALMERIEDYVLAMDAEQKEGDELDRQITELQKEQDKNSEIRLENQRIESEIEKRKTLIYSSEEGIRDNNIELTKARAENFGQDVEKRKIDLEEKKKAWEVKKKEAKKAEETVAELKGTIEVRKFWLKEVFAANGLKAYIFKAMLDELNQYTAKYGTKLGCSIRFSLDLTKVSAPFSTICSLGDKINKEYKEFSGGEEQRLDIVLMFAMHDLLSSTTGMNILIMDEVFEGLDEQGESDVFELIREKAENRSVYVISHSQVLDTLHSKTIEINSNQGKTEILDGRA